MSGYGFWLGVWLASLNIVLVGHEWWVLVIFVYVGGIIWFNYQSRWWLTILLAGGCFLYWQNREIQLHTAELAWQSQAQRHVQLITYQTDCHVEQGQVYGIGKLASGEKVCFRYRGQHGDRLRKSSVEKMMLTGLAKASPLEKRCNLYGFNQQQYWRSKGVVVQLTLNAVSTEFAAMSDDGFALIKRLQRLSIDWFTQFPEGIRDFGTALLLGQVREHFYQDYAGLIPLGLIHLFSISGFQVVFYWRLWQWVGRCLSLYQEVTWLSWVFGLGFIWVFANQVASLLRPILASLAEVWQRIGWSRWSPLDRYGYVLIVSLGCLPGVLLTIAGQLSFLLALGLVLLKSSPTIWQTLFLNLLIAPLLVWHTYGWHPGAILVNLLAIPFFSAVLIPGLLGALITWPLGITVVANGMNSVIKGIQYGTNMLAQLPGELVFGRPPKVIIIGLTMFMLAACLVQRLRWLWALPIVGLALMLARPIWQTPFLAFLDVGQGDAIVWREPSGKVYMNDVGGQIWTGGRQVHQDTAKMKTVWQFCRGKGITELEWLILSHRDWDHIGNFKAVSHQLRIKHLGLPAGMEKNGHISTLAKTTFKRHASTSA